MSLRQNVVTALAWRIIRRSEPRKLLFRPSKRLGFEFPSDTLTRNRVIPIVVNLFFVVSLDPNPPPFLEGLVGFLSSFSPIAGFDAHLFL